MSSSGCPRRPPVRHGGPRPPVPERGGLAAAPLRRPDPARQRWWQRGGQDRAPARPELALGQGGGGQHRAALRRLRGGARVRQEGGRHRRPASRHAQAGYRGNGCFNKPY